MRSAHKTTADNADVQPLHLTPPVRVADRDHPDLLQKVDITTPALHAAPADFAFSGQPLPEAFGDFAGFPEGFGDLLCIRDRILRPFINAGGGIDANDAVFADAEFVKLATDH